MNPNYTFVAKRAGHICEYCHAPEAVFNLQFEVEHIKPISRGGAHTENNLALSCRSCNVFKSDSVSFFDEETQKTSRLFNPRRNVWKNHFKTNYQTGEISGLTTIGRVTAACLKMNGKTQIAARVQWLKLGLFE